ncbi:hypothetical protein RUM44_002355 [Polyplax serrata]|uniref:MICOS complex subunit MIC60 n=1 Tax=Polyplax serrata TaxID=468196 RepID=A0ABR1AMM1_POLSC
MLPNAPKIPSCNFIWKRHVSNGPSRLYLVTNFYRKNGFLKQRPTRLEFKCKYSTDPCNPLPAALRAKGPCPEPQPSCEPPPKKKPTGFVTTLAIIGVGTAAVIAYAKYDCEFRRYIEEKAPLFNEFIKISTQEENTYGESWEKFVKYVLSWFDFSSKNTKDSKKGPICPPTDVKYEAPKSAFQPLLDDDPNPNDKNKMKCTPELKSKYSEIRVVDPPSPEIPKPDPITIGETSRQNTMDLVENLPDFHPKNVVELERHIGQAANEAVKAYYSAVCATKDHAEEIYKLLETKIDRIEPEFWCTLKKKTEEKENLIKSAEKAALKASERINKLQSILDDPAFGAPESLKVQAKRNIAKVLRDIEKSKRELNMEKDRSGVTEQYWQKVEQARRHFQDELEILFPSLKIDDKKFDLKPGELDLFLVHVYHYIVYYQKEISKLETIGELRIKEALQKGGERLKEDALATRVKQEVEKEKRDLFQDLQKKILGVKAEQERAIKVQMKRQLEAAEDYLHDAMEAKEKEMARKTQRLIDEKVEIERNSYKTKLAEMVGRMQGVEAALSSRLASDRMATQAQVLFSACQSFYRALRVGVPGLHYTKGLRPLDPEIAAIKKAAGKDDVLVGAVLNSLPEEARSRGVFPEIAIRERFLKVERTARKLALIPDGGSSLPRYFLSYLQSFLLFRSDNPIPSAELDDQPVNISKLDTYDILERSRYWLDRGDFGMALRYMNLLKGAPRQVACEWMNETRIFLETQQAADTLMAYAAATGQQFT